MNTQSIKYAECTVKDIKEQLRDLLDDDYADTEIMICANDASYLVEYIEYLEKIAIWAASAEASHG